MEKDQNIISLNNQKIEYNNPILKITFDFAKEIILYCETLEDLRKYVVSRQLLKSGTSIGANVREAQSAESIQDFYHKFKIAAKEAEESEYWLLLCKEIESYPSSDTLIEAINRIKKIIGKIISSTKLKLGKNAVI